MKIIIDCIKTIGELIIYTLSLIKLQDIKLENRNYKSTHHDSDFEVLLQHINSTTRYNKYLVNTYIFILISFIFTSLDITYFNYLLNKDIKIFSYEVSINIETYLFYAPFVILIFHIFVIENLLLYYLKIKSFLKIKNNLILKRNNYLLAFILNDNNLYLNTFKIKPTTFIVLFSIILLPIGNIVFFVGYSNHPYFIYVIIIIVISISNLYLFAHFSNKTAKSILAPVSTYGLIFLISNTIALYSISQNNQTKSLNSYLKVTKSFIDVDITPLNKNIDNILKFDVTDSKFKVLYSDYYEGIESNNRSLNNINIKYSDIINSKFKNSELNEFHFNEVSLVKNKFYNSVLRDFELFDSKILNTSFLGDMTFNKSYFSYLIEDIFQIENKYRTEIINWKLYRNEFDNTIFEDVKFEDVEFMSDNIFKNSKFVDNIYKNVKFRDSIFINTSFKGGTLGITDDELRKNEINFSKEQKIRKSVKSKLNKNEKELVFIRNTKSMVFYDNFFKNTTFDNVTFNNVVFTYSSFKNVEIKNKTLFNNCTFIIDNYKDNISFLKNIKKYSKSSDIYYRNENKVLIHKQIDEIK